MPTLAAGTVCYQVCILHLDNVTGSTTIGFSLGVVEAAGPFIATSQTQFQMTLVAFWAAFGAAGTALENALTQILVDVPADLAPLVSALSGVPYFPSGGLPAGTPCYQAGVLHIDAVNSLATTSFILGVTELNGTFIETSRFTFQMTLAAFFAAFGADGTTLSNALTTVLADVPADLAPLVPALNGIPIYH